MQGASRTRGGFRLRATALVAYGLGGALLAEDRVLELVSLSHSGTAPGSTGTFTDFGTPVMNRDGTIAYLGFGDDLGFADLGGVWVHTIDGNVTPVALAGSDTPWPFSENNPDTFAQYTIPEFFYLGRGNKLIVGASRGFVFSNLNGEPVEYIGPPLTESPGGFNRFNTDPVFADDSAPFTMFVQGQDIPSGLDDLLVYRNGSLTPLSMGGEPSGVSTGIPFAPYGAFRSMVTTSGGALIVHAGLDPFDPLWTFSNGTALYAHSASGARLIVESDTQLGDAIGQGNFALFPGNFLPERPSANAGGRVVFRMYRTSDLHEVILATELTSAELQLVVEEGQVVADQLGGSATLESLGERPVVNQKGDVYFRAGEPGFVESLWRAGSGMFERIMKSGDVAPGTGGAEFAGPDCWVVNAEGRVAMLATLELGGDPPVTTDNDFGLWLQDDEGNFGLVARTGTRLMTGGTDHGTISSIEFETNGEEGTGNDEGIMSGLGDLGDLVFLVELSGGAVEGQRAIVRSRLLHGGPSGDIYLWSGAAGDNQWHGKNGDTSNWNDDSGISWPEPPGTRGKEIVKVDPGVDIVLDSRQADISRLNSKGSLEVRQDLFLAEDSSAESLTLTNGADVSLRGKLMLAGDNNRLVDGQFKQGHDNGVLEISSGATLTIPGAASDRRAIHADWINRGLVRQHGDLRSSTDPGVLGQIRNLGSYVMSNSAKLEVDRLLQEVDSDLTVEGGTGNYINNLEVMGGRLRIKSQAQLKLHNSTWEGKSSSTMIDEGATLGISNNPSGIARVKPNSEVVVRGFGNFIARNASLRLDGSSKLTLRVPNISFENVGLYDPAADSSFGSLKFEKDAFVETRPTATIKSSDMGRIDIVNAANLIVEGQVFHNGHMENTSLGDIALNNAILQGDSVSPWAWFFENSGDIRASGTNQIGGSGGVFLLKEGKVTVAELASLVIHRLGFAGPPEIISGDWEVQSGGVLSIFSNAPITRVGPEATVLLIGSGTLNDLPSSAAATFRLDGVLELRDGADGLFRGAITIGPGGILILNNASLTGPALTFERGSVFFGSGSDLNGLITNKGLIHIGSSPGSMQIQGSYEQSGTGALQIEIGGPTPGDEYDQLLVEGDAGLGGTLLLSLLDDYRPTQEERFQVVQADSITGEFERIVAEQQLSGLEFEVEYDIDSVWVRVVPVAANSFQLWAAQQFTPEQLADAALSDTHANPDWDYLINLLEYVFGRDALASGDGFPVSLGLNEFDELAFSFPWRKGVGDAAYSLERSYDAVDWEAADPLGIEVAQGDPIDKVTLRIKRTDQENETAYFRLTVSQ